MTCVLAYRIKNKGVVLMGDTQATDNQSYTYENRLDPKVFKLGNIVFGICGSYRLRDLLMYELKLPKRAKNESIDKYVRTKLVEEIRKLFAEKGCIHIKDGEHESLGNVLIGIKDRLYRMDCDFQIGEIDRNYDAIGCGELIALGALDMEQKSPMNNKYKRDYSYIKFLLKEVMSIVAGRSCGVNNITTVESTIE